MAKACIPDNRSASVKRTSGNLILRSWRGIKTDKTHSITKFRQNYLPIKNKSIVHLPDIVMMITFMFFW